MVCSTQLSISFSWHSSDECEKLFLSYLVFKIPSISQILENENEIKRANKINKSREY